ncbi:MAG: peptidoglycan-binding domain-containing protein [Gemmatimonadaceae bacterium]
MKLRAVAITAALVPAIAMAQDPTYGRDTTRAQGRDTTRAQAPRTERDRSADQPRVRSEARGAVDISRSSRGVRGRTTWGLSTTQIREFQQALQRIDCYDAEIDGIIGPRTRAGIACAMRHHTITGEDPNALTQALSLDFEVDANAGLGAVMRSGARARGRSDMRGDIDKRAEQQADTSDPESRADTLQGARPTTTPTPQNVPPR